MSNNSVAYSNVLVLDRGNVGVGTENPSRKLHVNAGTDNEAVRIESSDTEVAVELKDSTGTATIRSRGDFRFDGSSGEIMRMESGGKIGIGTTGPVAQLHLNTATTETLMQITNSTTGSAISDGLRFGCVGNNVTFINRENANMSFSTNNTLALNIDNSQNVSIEGDLTVEGTFHPLSLLSKHYNTTNTSSSVTAGSSLDDEYELLTFGESASPLYLNIKTSAHNSASFVITRGYHGSNTASIQCTGSTYTANGGYANIRGLRVIKSGTAYKVIVRLFRSGSHVAFNLFARAWGGTASEDIVFNTTLTDTFTETTALGGINDLSQSSSLSAAYSRDALWVDDAKAAFGNTKDLQIYHAGGNSFINETGTGSLLIQSSDLFLRAGGTNNTNNALVAANSGAVTLYHANTAKLATTSGGVLVTGDINLTGTAIYKNSGTLEIKSQIINIKGVTTNENIAGFNENGSVDLYHNNSKKFETTSTGVTVTGATNRFVVDSSTASAIDIGFISSARTIRAVETGGANARPLTFLAQNFTFKDDSATRMTIDSSGNVGIGTTSPQSIFEIQSSSPEITIGGSAINQFESGRIRFTEQRNATAGLQGGYIHYDGSANKLHIGMHNTTDTTVSNDANAITILRTNQNVGIGTDSPDAKLQVRIGGIGSNANDEVDGVIFEGDRHDLIYKQIRTGATSDWNSTTLRLQTRVDTTLMSSIDFATDASFNRHIDINTASNSFNTRFTHNGRVGIGTTSPSNKLHVKGGAITRVKIESSGSNTGVLLTENGSDKWSIASTSGTLTAFSESTLGTKMSLSATGTLTLADDVIAFGSPSDKRLKENVKPIKSALDKVCQLNGVTFDWKKNESILDIKEDIGFIAQDVQKVLPQLVKKKDDGMLSLRHQGIVPVLLEAIKELKQEVEELKKQIK